MIDKTIKIITASEALLLLLIIAEQFAVNCSLWVTGACPLLQSTASARVLISLHT